MTLDEARESIGAMVRYQPNGLFPQNAEIGLIRSVNAQYVFVQYEGDYGSKATDPADLTLILKGSR
jgi:hypothetical protein